MSTSNGRKRMEVGHLDPSRVLDIAYSYHVSDDAKLRDTPIGKLAKRIVREFESLCRQPERFSSEWEYLMAVQSIIVSLSRGITRGKTEYAKKLQDAEDEKELEMKEMSAAAKNSGMIRGSFKAALLCGLGFAVMQVVAPSIELTSKNPTYSGAVAGIGAILVGTWLQSLWIHNRMQKIFLLHEYSINHAHYHYRKELLEEYNRAKQSATEAWVRYTGEAPIEWTGFEQVLAEDLVLIDTYLKGRFEITASPFVKIMRSLNPRSLIRAALGRGEDEDEEQPRRKPVEKVLE